MISYSKIFCLVIIYVCLSASSFAQTFDVLADKIKFGSVEEKREALYQIRNLETAEASRLALPLLNDPAEIVRATATHSVLALPSDEAFFALIPLLKDKLPYVREEAAYALGKTRNAKAIEPLIQLLQTDKVDEVRGACAFALGLIGDLKSEDALIYALQKTKNLFVQRSSARSLGQIKSKKAATLLIQILRDKKRDDDVKRESAWALGEIGDISAKQVLQENANGKDYLLAKICKEALKKIKM